MRAATVRVDVHLQPDDLARALREDVRCGLMSMPKEVPSKWFYDDVGSRLFDEITRLPEYYLTRRERSILEARAADIARAGAADTLVELGSGTSEKTRILLDALTDEGSLRRFVPFDVSEGILREAAGQINEEHPSIEVHAVVGDFERHLRMLPDGGRRMFAFLGSTIGNFPPQARASFLGELAGTMHPGDTLLIGFDLVKAVDRLEAAYNDAAGVTDAFNRNVLHVLNRELGADFAVDRFDHVAFFDPDEEWMEMRLLSTRRQRVRIPSIGVDVEFADGESVRTEISAKFRVDRIDDELTSAGLSIAHLWTDSDDDFALVLARR
jgi:L-histidine N-alpha-methyltransferase